MIADSFLVRFHNESPRCFAKALQLKSSLTTQWLVVTSDPKDGLSRWMYQKWSCLLVAGYDWVSKDVSAYYLRIYGNRHFSKNNYRYQYNLFLTCSRRVCLINPFTKMFGSMPMLTTYAEQTKYARLQICPINVINLDIL